MKSGLSFLEAGCWLGYRLLRVTSVAIGRPLVAWDSALRHFSGRGCLPARWEARARFSPQPGMPARSDVLWAHAASLGEAAGLLALLQHAPTPGELLLTAQTAAGLARLRAAAPNLERPGRSVRVAVAPWENAGIAGRFLGAQGVTRLLLYESELWPGWLEAANKKGVPVYWISARCGHQAWRTARRFPGIARALLKGLTWIQARSSLEADRLRAFAPGRVSVGMDAKGLGQAERGLAGQGPSLQPAAHGIALYCIHRSEWSRLKPQLASLMALAPVCVLPRKPEEFAFFQRELQPLGFALHSEGGREGHLLVDALGQAGTYLSRCHAVYVGGSWNGLGGHAFWEPLRLGLRLASGPHLHQQQPLADRLQSLGLLTVWSQGDLASCFAGSGPTRHAESARRVFWGEVEAQQNAALAELRAFLVPGQASETTPCPVTELSLV